MLFTIFDSTFGVLTFGVLIALTLLCHFLVFAYKNLPDGYRIPPSWIPFIPSRNGKAPVSAALRLLAEAGMRKINFAGGEPFLYPKILGTMIDYCKTDLNLESVSIVNNGSLIKEDFFRHHAANLDILAVSCDSFNEQTNIAIGRGSSDQVPKLYQLAAWCREYGVLFKLNTVVNQLIATEDMNSHITALRPHRWKAFQVLIVSGENDSAATLRNGGHKFTISDGAPGKQPSKPILEVGVDAALGSVFWDEEAFPEGGKGGCGGGSEEELAW
ncbi:hypothetical protein F5144DRAFT_620596 [Chaetomium tenue]|uniref:Uncharacterized protein n=1 Tax=Chaetomium tenue TaxID=1854479 RepID=A0ACB7P5J9_9PEZI|nr:hypothetical protein F5144DRAFT_620596 [Chaetomium globosum]